MKAEQDRQLPLKFPDKKYRDALIRVRKELEDLHKLLS
jgi:hypothetical protein